MRGLSSSSSQLLWKRVLVEGAEFAFFGVDAPAPPHNAQTGHHRDGEIDTKDAGDFSARENTNKAASGCNSTLTPMTRGEMT